MKNICHSVAELGVLHVISGRVQDICLPFNICDRQFQPAFKRETDGELPSKGNSPLQLIPRGSPNCWISSTYIRHVGLVFKECSA